MKTAAPLYITQAFTLTGQPTDIIASWNRKATSSPGLPVLDGVPAHPKDWHDHLSTRTPEGTEWLVYTETGGPDLSTIVLPDFVERVSRLSQGAINHLCFVALRADAEESWQLTLVQLEANSDSTWMARLDEFPVIDELQSALCARTADQAAYWTAGSGQQAAFEAFLSPPYSRNPLAQYCALHTRLAAHSLPAWLAFLVEAVEAMTTGMLLPGRLHRDGYAAPAGFLHFEVPRPWICRYPAPMSATCGIFIEGHLLALRLSRPADSEWPLSQAEPPYLFCLSAASPAQFAHQLQELQGSLASTPDIARLADALWRTRAGSYRASLIASTATELSDKLQKLAKGIQQANRSPARSRQPLYWNLTGLPPGKVAAIFPGQGAQRPHMLGQLCGRFPRLRGWFNQLEAALVDINDVLPSLSLFPPADGLTESQQAALRANLYSQEGGNPMVVVAGIALHALFQSFGCGFDVLMGHSSGEISAMLAGGSLRIASEATLFTQLAAITQQGSAGNARGEIPKGCFFSVTTTEEAVIAQLLRELEGIVYLAMDNCPQQRVIFTRDEHVALVSRRLAELGVLAIALPFDRAYHTPLFEVEIPSIRQAYNQFDVAPPQTPIFSCIELGYFPDEPEAIKEWAARNWTHCVQFRDACLQLHEAGVRVFLELGPGNTLSGFVSNTLGEKTHKALPIDHDGADSYLLFLQALGQLFIEGTDVDLSPLFPTRVAVPAPQPAAPARSAAPVPTAARPPQRPTAQAMRAAQLGLAHFELMQEFLAMESRVITGFLAGARRTTGKTRPRSVEREDLSRRLPQLPLLDWVEQQSARQLTCGRLLQRQYDTFLAHHTLGRYTMASHAAGDPLPVMPLALTIELVAEAASLLFPAGYVVCGLYEIKALQWITVAGDSLPLRLDVRLMEQGAHAGRAFVQAFVEHDLESPVCTAFVQLAPAYPAAPRPQSFEVQRPERLRWDAESFFDQCLFHGTAFSCIEELTGLSPECVQLDLAIPASDALFASGAPTFKTPAQLLDVPGHAAAYWMVEHGDQRFGIFPLAIQQLKFFAPPPPAFTRLVGSGQLEKTGTLLHTDFELAAPGGEVYCRLEGCVFVYYRFELSFLKSHYWTGPHSYYTQEVAVLSDRLIANEAQSFPEEFLRQGGGLWLKSLLHMFCNATERASWEQLTAKGNRREQWLLGRIAAKEVVRRWAMRLHSLYLPPSDIEIRYDANGKPLVHCDHLLSFGELPEISITHSGRRAVAAAALPGYAVGIDLEQLGPPQEEDARLEIVFSEDELAAIRRFEDLTLLELTSAKESAAKAVGLGLLGRMRQWRVTDRTPEGVRIRAGDATIDVHIATQMDAVFTYCTIPNNEADRVRAYVQDDEVIFLSR